MPPQFLPLGASGVLAVADVDRQTGLVIDNLSSAFQGVEVTLSTRIGSRLMRREFGGGVAELLGRRLTPSLFAAWQQLIGTSIDIWEPRFGVRRVIAKGSAEELRRGTADLTIEADFRPRGHLGDFSVERVVSFDLRFNPTGVVASGF